MSGHRHNPSAQTQNQGNSIGDRSSVRQSKLYRVHEGGNNMKSILGTDHLSWDADQQQGAYYGQPVYDHSAADPFAANRSKGGRMGDFTDNSYQSTYETTSGGYGGSPPRNSKRNDYDYDDYSQPKPQSSQAEARANSSRGNASFGVAGSLQPDIGGGNMGSSRRTDYAYAEASSSYPLSKMRGEDNQVRTTHRDMRDQYSVDSSAAYPPENSRSLAASLSRRGSADSKSTRPW